MIELRDIGKFYLRDGEVIPVLKQIDLDIDAGDFVSIMGDSGSGKTTLLNILGCLDVASQGHYRLNGQILDGASDEQLSAIRNRDIGFVFQSAHFVEYLDLVDNVALPGYYADGKPQANRRRAEELLIEVGLEHRLAHRPSELSGGEAQRAALARALLNNPSLILADEPTGNLDHGNAAQIVERLAQLGGEGITVIMVTHDERSSRAANRRLTLNQGELSAAA
jgi:ABC-type lipoprotein export system ATPase subunit